MIIAIWSKGLPNVYDAFEVAEWLGFEERSQDKRRRLEHHRDEYLVLGEISADEYRILAVFDGRSVGRFPLSVAGQTGSASIPDGFSITSKQNGQRATGS